MTRAMAGHHCTLTFSAVAVFAARYLYHGDNPFPAPAGRQGPNYGYGRGAGGIPGFSPGGFFGGVEVPTVLCQEKGPCYGKKVACPNKCFWSYSRAGNGYGAGGGGGSCTVDCKYKCTASC